MYFRMTDLLVDLLDRYEPEPAGDEAPDLVTEETAGVQTFGSWTLLAESSIEDEGDVAALIDRLGLARDEEFALSESVMAFNADALPREDLLALLEAVDAECGVVEVSGEIDVHERSLTWMGEGETLEPMPMPVPRPGDEIPLLVEEFAIHLARHEAPLPEREDATSTFHPGIELFGRPYLLLRDEIEDSSTLLKLLEAAGVPEPIEARVHRVEWDGDVLRPAHVYRAVHALKPVNPAVGFVGGVTWRNEGIEVDEAEDDA